MRKNYFKKLAIVASFILMGSGLVQAQVNNPIANIKDTTGFKPDGKLWGYTFGDYYYINHADQFAADRGNSKVAYVNAATPQNFSAFDFRRIYLGYDYNIAPNFSSQIVLAHENQATGSTNTDAGGNRTLYIKYASVRWKGIYHNADLVVGQQQTLGFVYNSEMVWGYRTIEKTITDLHGTINSTDLGVSLQGKVNNEGTFGYDAMVGNNNGAKLASSTFKLFSGDLWTSLMDHKIIVDVYGNWARNHYNDAYNSTQSDAYYTGVFKAFAAYTTPRITVGVEYFMQNNHDGLMIGKGANQDTANISTSGISIFARAQIIPGKLNIYAMFDMYNNDNNYSKLDTAQEKVLAGKGYSSYAGNYNENMWVAGLDYMPNKNIHLMPNVWYYGYTNNENSGIKGFYGNDHYMVYRISFYYVFNKAPMMPSDK